MPNYPGMKNSNLDFTIPESANIYGQNFFCLSLTKADIEKLAQNLLITRPNIYFNSIKSIAFPNLRKLGEFPKIVYTSKFSQVNLNVKGSKEIVNSYNL